MDDVVCRQHLIPTTVLIADYLTKTSYFFNFMVNLLRIDNDLHAWSNLSQPPA